MSVPQAPRSPLTFAQYAGLAAQRYNVGRPVGQRVAAVRPSAQMTRVADAWQAVDADAILRQDLRDCAVARRDDPNAECKITQADVDRAVTAWAGSPAAQEAVAQQARSRENRQRLKQSAFGPWPEGITDQTTCDRVQGNLRRTGEFAGTCFHRPGTVGGRSPWAKFDTEAACLTGRQATPGGPIIPGVWREIADGEFACAAPPGFGRRSILRDLRAAGLTAGGVAPAGSVSAPAALAQISGNGFDGYGQWAPDQYDRRRRDYNDMAGQDYSNGWNGRY